MRCRGGVADGRQPNHLRRRHRGLRADGWADGCQSNTLTIAMVIWPNTDYHFYRVVTGGPDWWWEHKPGGTPARWTDDSNRPLFGGPRQ